MISTEAKPNSGCYNGHGEVPHSFNLNRAMHALLETDEDVRNIFGVTDDDFSVTRKDLNTMYERQHSKDVHDPKKKAIVNTLRAAFALDVRNTLITNAEPFLYDDEDKVTGVVLDKLVDRAQKNVVRMSIVAEQIALTGAYNSEFARIFKRIIPLLSKEMGRNKREVRTIIGASIEKETKLSRNTLFAYMHLIKEIYHRDVGIGMILKDFREIFKNSLPIVHFMTGGTLARTHAVNIAVESNFRSGKRAFELDKCKLINVDEKGKRVVFIPEIRNLIRRETVRLSTTKWYKVMRTGCVARVSHAQESSKETMFDPNNSLVGTVFLLAIMSGEELMQRRQMAISTK